MNILGNNSALSFPGELTARDRARDDAELIRLFLQGNDTSFSVLLERHMPMVYRFVYRYLANADDTNDVTQETFIRAWKHIKRFDTSRSFKTWVLAIAKNASLDFIKKKKPILFSQIEAGDADLDAVLEPHLTHEELPDAMFDRMTDAKYLESKLAKLPVPYRVVLTLRYSEHLKFREIAEVLGQPIDTVKSKHRRGLMSLRKIMDHKALV
jgi:RNA polymerase sigma-70 factor (ECF subfamily)